MQAVEQQAALGPYVQTGQTVRIEDQALLLVRGIGEGASGVVYEARDVVTGAACCTACLTILLPVACNRSWRGDARRKDFLPHAAGELSAIKVCEVPTDALELRRSKTEWALAQRCAGPVGTTGAARPPWSRGPEHVMSETSYLST